MVKKVVVLLVVCLVTWGSAIAEFDVNGFLASGKYSIDPTGNVIIQTDPTFVSAPIYSDIYVSLTFGVMNNGITPGLYLPTMTIIIYYSPEDFENIESIHWAMKDANGNEIEYTYAWLPTPVQSNLTANASDISIVAFQACGYTLYIGTECQTVLESLFLNEKTYLALQTEGGESLYFTLGKDMGYSFQAFWEDYKGAGGLSEDALAAIDYFQPMAKLY